MAELGVVTRRGIEVTTVAQDEDGVDVLLEEDAPLRTSYLIGADGGRSAVRRAAGIALAGAPATHSYLIAEAVLAHEAPTGMRQDELGIHGINPTPDGDTMAILVSEADVGPATDPVLGDLSAALTATYGTDFGVHDPVWISRFSDATLQATGYRAGRVLIAGDAAHVHPPTGGQGLGLGIADAVGLGWKLAQVVRGVSPAALLDSYTDERHPATARVLSTVMTQAQLQRGDPRTVAIRQTFAELLADGTARLRLAALLTGLDVVHGTGDGHPALGRRMPDLDLDTPDGPRRVFELLHDARPVLLELAGPDRLGRPEPSGWPWADRVRRIDATAEETMELPVVGAVSVPAAVLIRPDGHVAWVDDGDGTGLDLALTAWFGPAGR